MLWTCGLIPLILLLATTPCIELFNVNLNTSEEHDVSL